MMLFACIATLAFGFVIGMDLGRYMLEKEIRDDARKDFISFDDGDECYKTTRLTITYVEKE